MVFRVGHVMGRVHKAWSNPFVELILIGSGGAKRYRRKKPKDRVWPRTSLPSGAHGGRPLFSFFFPSHNVSGRKYIISFAISSLYRSTIHGRSGYPWRKQQAKHFTFCERTQGFFCLVSWLIRVACGTALVGNLVSDEQ
jgi:hypothetical protein